MWNDSCSLSAGDIPMVLAEDVLVGVGPVGVLSNFLGARLYNQKDVYKNAQTAQALSLLYPHPSASLITVISDDLGSVS